MNKWIKIVLVCLLMSGQLPVQALASLGTVQSEHQLANGLYTIEQLVLQGDSDEVSSAGKFLQAESELVVTEEETTLQLVFTSGSLMSNLKIAIAGESIDFEETLTGTGMNSTLALKFPIPSLTEQIDLEMTIMGTMTHTVRILLQVETLKVRDVDTPEVPETELPEIPNPEVPETELPETETPDSEQGATDYYTIEQHVYKFGTTTESIAGNFLQKLSTITETNGQKQLTLTFDSGSLISNVQIRINGVTIPTEQMQTGSGEQATLAIRFKIANLTDVIEMDMTIMGTMHHTVAIVLQPETLTLLNEAPTPPSEPSTPVEPTPEVTPTPDVTPNVPEADLSQRISVDQLVVGKKYVIKNTVISTVTTPRKAVNEYSYLQRENTGYTLTLGMSMLDLMTNIRFTVAGQAVTPVTLNATATTSDFQIVIPTVATPIFVTAYIPALGRDVTFEIQLNANEIYAMSAGQSQQSLGAANEQAVNTAVTPTPELTVEATQLAVTKRYTIQNDVLSTSELGYSMARKYLQAQSLIEVVDEQYYLSLTFTGTDMMENIHFSVNGTAVDAELTLNDTSQFMQTYRFKIGALTDEITAHMFIIPSQMTIQFGVQLLPETLVELLGDETLGGETPETSAMTVKTPTVVGSEVDLVKRASLLPTLLVSVSIIGASGGSYAMLRNKKKKSVGSEKA